MPVKNPLTKGLKRKALFSQREDLYLFEAIAFGRGAKWVAGVDEAGRGSLAGPVVAAAVILGERVDPSGVKDSKLLGPKLRERLFKRIVENAVSISLGVVGPEEINKTNIHKATLMAMQLAVLNLTPRPDLVLVDGPHKVPFEIPQEAIVHGDRRSLSIASASIVAKVYRDRIMQAMDQVYPGYGFGKHKGYGTRDHLNVLRIKGPCPIHRLYFKGVRCEGHQRIGQTRGRAGPSIFGGEGFQGT